ncbi:hypothetical protein QE152_g9400 [Popillia japonica]|uniref:Uncharacterized protein n=1 Tax=Popillia japonica TaxID=7064 RepID=A0AAW1LZG4_POPJA
MSEVDETCDCSSKNCVPADNSIICNDIEEKSQVDPYLQAFFEDTEDPEFWAFNEAEWERFMLESENLKKFFEYCRGMFPAYCIDDDDVKLSSECFDGVTRILKIEKGEGAVFLSYEGLLELLRLRKIVSSRVSLLKSLKFNEVYKDVVTYLSGSDGDLSDNLENMFHGGFSECSCLMTELATY